MPFSKTQTRTYIKGPTQVAQPIWRTRNANAKVIYATKYNHVVLATNFGDPNILQM
jgi:hypothetical protein